MIISVCKRAIAQPFGGTFSTWFLEVIAALTIPSGLLALAMLMAHAM
jgi:hypothetical protein